MSQSICKYEDALIDFDLSGGGLEKSPEYLEIIQAIQECDTITDYIVEKFAEIDNSIREFKEKIYDVSDSMTSFSGDILEAVGNYKPKNDQDSEGAAIMGMVGLAVGAFGLATKGVGHLVSKARQKKADRERERMIEETIEKKMEIVQEKFEPVSRLRNKFSSTIVPRIKKLYQKEFSQTVSTDDTLMDSRVGMFKRTLGLKVKSEFMIHTLDYAIAEMEAWKAGKDDADFYTLSIMDFLEREVRSWEKAIGADGNHKGWDGFVKYWLDSQSSNYPVPIALLFSEPAFLSNYVGIDITLVDNCPSALLKLSINNPENTPIPKLIERNPYYIDCVNNIKENWHVPERPAGFGVTDLLLLLAPIAFAFMTAYFSFMYFPGKFMRICGATLALAIGVCFPIMFFGNGELNLPIINLPYIKRENEWHQVIDGMLAEIRSREETFRTENSTVRS